MIKKIVLIGFLILELNVGFCQKLFYEDFSFYNPAYTGIFDKINLTFSTSEYKIKDSDFKKSTGRLAINVPLKKLHSGIGFHALYNKIETFSLYDLGIIYSFRYNFSNNFSLSLGSNFSLHTEIIKGDFFVSGVPFEDYGDYYVDEKNRLFNIDLGIWIKYKNFQVGLTNQHINSPTYDIIIANDTIPYKLGSIFNAIVNYNLPIGQNLEFKNSLLIPNIKDFKDSKIFYINNLIEIKNTYLIGITTELFKSSEIKGFMSPNIGINLADKFEFLMSVELIKINTYNSKGKTIEGILTFNF